MNHRPNLYLDVASHGLLRRATDNGYGPQPHGKPWTAVAIYSAAIALAAMLLWGG